MSNTMTNEEAIAKLEVYSSTNGSGQCTSEEHQEAKRLAIEALKKQIPKKPIFDEEMETYYCPNCKMAQAYAVDDFADYCELCGQAIDKSLDWSDSNVKQETDN